MSCHCHLVKFEKYKFCTVSRVDLAVRCFDVNRADASINCLVDFDDDAGFPGVSFDSFVDQQNEVVDFQIFLRSFPFWAIVHHRNKT